MNTKTPIDTFSFRRILARNVTLPLVVGVLTALAFVGLVVYLLSALRSVELMRFMLAWRIQTKAHGGLDAETRRKVRRRGRLEMEGLSLGVGAVLRREWQGGTVEVEIVDGGFRWNGRQFRSLSAAATAIAGTRWNGPRFFGLREQAV